MRLRPPAPGGEERREAERLRGEQARPPVPDWIVERGIGQGGPPIEVHRGDCHAAGSRQAATAGHAG
ncbi:DUF6233 domain-containing protein [Streptomyces sp. PA5.6]|uniref:DUF6233 domain-containing protein n=1 Tax=Streptomyces sp. PA5.6 TaxID=3035651 RepID=UPI003904B6EE